MRKFTFIAFLILGLSLPSLAGSDVFDQVPADDREKISVYPNPAQDRVNILVPHGSEITMYDLVGQKLELETLSEIEKKEGMSYTFDLQDLPKGLYFIKVKNLENKTHDLIKFKKL